jgi:hypothetical protein
LRRQNLRHGADRQTEALTAGAADQGARQGFRWSCCRSLSGRKAFRALVENLLHAFLCGANADPFHLSQLATH